MHGDVLCHGGIQLQAGGSWHPCIRVVTSSWFFVRTHADEKPGQVPAQNQGHQETPLVSVVKAWHDAACMLVCLIAIVQQKDHSQDIHSFGAC